MRPAVCEERTGRGSAEGGSRGRGMSRGSDQWVSSKPASPEALCSLQIHLTPCDSGMTLGAASLLVLTSPQHFLHQCSKFKENDHFPSGKPGFACILGQKR